MDTKQKQALNEKITKWCEFDYRKYLDSDYGINRPDHLLIHYKGTMAVPNFCDYMDAHIKWTLPKLPKNIWFKFVRGVYEDIVDLKWHCELDFGSIFKPTIESNAESPSMALSLAIGKLIEEYEEMHK
jgi:hypothetical protein